MIVSLSNAAARGALVGLALAMAAYLSYFSVRTARATYYTETEPLHGFEQDTHMHAGTARDRYLGGRYLQYGVEDTSPERAISSYLRSVEIERSPTPAW